MGVDEDEAGSTAAGVAGASADDQAACSGVPVGYELQYLSQAVVALSKYTSGSETRHQSCALNYLGLLWTAPICSEVLLAALNCSERLGDALGYTEWLWTVLS